LNLSKAQRSKGGFREITDINAIVGVKKMKGGKEHYLSKQERNAIKRGNSQTAGKVAMPINKNARTGGIYQKSVKGALRLQKAGAIQTLKIGSKKIGTPSDGFNARGGAQRWAILYREMRNPRQGWDLSKQFFFQGMKKGLGIFKKVGSKIKMTRSLEKSTVKPNSKYANKLQKSTKKLNENMMNAIFKRAALKFMRGK
jgi:hypothetical protein